MDEQENKKEENGCVICGQTDKSLNGGYRELITRLGTYVNATGKWVHLNCETF